MPKQNLKLKKINKQNQTKMEPKIEKNKKIDQKIETKKINLKLKPKTETNNSIRENSTNQHTQALTTCNKQK